MTNTTDTSEFVTTTTTYANPTSVSAIDYPTVAFVLSCLLAGIFSGLSIVGDGAGAVLAGVLAAVSVISAVAVWGDVKK